MRFSVIIPSYNKGTSIRRAIDSVLTQTFQDFELIVVDNNSTDQSLETIGKICSEKLFVYHERQQGVSFARNTGWGKANGEYICFLDADDIYEPQNLERLNQLIIDNPGAGLYANRYKLLSIQGKEQVPTLNPTWMDGNKYILNNFFEAFVNGQMLVNTNSVCISKETISKHLGFDPRLTVGEDIYLWARLFLESTVVIGDYIGSVYHLNAVNRSIKHLHLQSYTLLLKKFEDLFNCHPNLKPYAKDYQAFVGYIVFGVAFACLRSGQKVEAKKWLQDNRLLGYPKKMSILFLKLMQYLPNQVNQLMLQLLRSIGRVNV